MSVLKSFVFDIGELAKDLEAMGRQAPIVLARGLNRAGAEGQTAMVRAIAEDTGIQQKNIRREIRLDKATRTEPRVVVEIAGKRIPLIAFSARGPEPSRGKGRGVSYRLPSGRGRIPEAFIATVGIGGHRGVFKRRAKKRLPIRELFGPSLPHVFEKKLPVFEAAAGAALMKTLAHEITFAKSKEGAATLPATA